MLTTQELAEVLTVAGYDDRYGRHGIGGGPEPRFLGRGHFSRVYAFPGRDDLAIKVSNQPNDGGVLYAFWARSHQGLPGVPEIHHIHQQQCGAQFDRYTQTVIVMKRYRMVLRDYYNREGLAQYGGISADEAGDVLRDALSGRRGVPVVPSLQAVVDTCVDIGKFFQGAAGFDLHLENIMLDENNCLIITDPLSWSSKTKEEVFQGEPDTVRATQGSRVYLSRWNFRKDAQRLPQRTEIKVSTLLRSPGRLGAIFRLLRPMAVLGNPEDADQLRKELNGLRVACGDEPKPRRTGRSPPGIQEGT